MNISIILSVFALILSGLSIWMSYRNHRDNLYIKKSESRRSFDREKSEFMVRIEKAQSKFESLEHELKILIDRIESADEVIKGALFKEVDQLNLDLSNLGGSMRQARSLHDETYNISQEGFAHQKPRYLKLIEDDEEMVLEAYKRIALAKKMLESKHKRDQ